jgi:streptogramin lyase
MRTETDSYLGRFDGQDWTIHSTADGLPPVGVGFFADEIDRLAVASDGRVWFSVIPQEEDGPPLGGLVAFDGQDFTRYLEGSWVSDFAIAPDGSVWTTDTLDQGIHVIRPDEVTTAE